MSPAASVEFRVPDDRQEQPRFNTSPYCKYPGNPNLPSSLSFEYGNASGVGNGSESCGGLFNSRRSAADSAQNGRVQEIRSKPRLVKVRRGFGSRRMRSAATSISVDSGFNPFQSVPQSSDQLKDDSGRINGFQSSTKISAASGEPKNVTFVFGGNISLGDSNSNSNDNKQRGGRCDGIGNAPAPDEEAGKTAGKPRCSDGEVRSSEPCNKEKLETVCDRESSMFGNFVFGSGRVNGSLNREGTADNFKGGDFQKASSQSAASFVFVSGESTASSGEPKVSDQVTVESSIHQGSISGDQCSTRSSFEIPSDVKLSEDLKRLNIDHLPKTFNVENVHLYSTEAPAGATANGTFAFESSRSHSTSSAQSMSTANKMDKMKAAGNSKVIDEMNNGTSVRPMGEDLFVFGARVSNPSSSGVSSHSSAKCQFSQNPEKGEEKGRQDVDPSSFPAFLFGTATKYGAYATSGEEAKVEPVDFKVPQWDAFSFSASMYNTSDRKSESGVKSRILKDIKPKKAKGKARKHDILKQKSQQETDCCSPMDFSPYQESTVNEQYSPEGSVKLNPTTFRDVSSTPLDRSHVSLDNKYVNIAAASVDSQSKLFSGVDVVSDDAGTGVHSNVSHQKGDGSQFQFASNSGAAHQFMFAASTSTQGHSLPIKRQHKKKYRVKVGHVPSTAASVHWSSVGTSSSFDKKQVENGVMLSESNVKLKSATVEERATSALSSEEEACEKWRLRGNQAYKKGELYKAEDFYTWGINCIPSSEASGFSLKPLVLCYSNRAATRMALGRVRDALKDCLVAVTLDPSFLKAQIRAANCHLMLGELEEATQNFNKCMELGGGICLDRQLVITASDGLQKAQKVAKYISHAEELLKLKTSEDAVTALGTIAEGISISLHSEKLLELKAEALCLLQKYEDAIQLCEKTLGFADTNFSSFSPNNRNVDGSNVKTNSDMNPWRLQILAKCYFHLGRFEAALGVLDKHESGRSSQDSDPLVITINELLKHKNAGNEAFRSGKHAESVEHYTSAVSCSIESRPFAAVCFCNRAAAYQILGQIADAISDCSVAIALDENYVKAVSRRANLHEKIRDYKQAASDLQKLVSILEKRSPGKAKQSGSSNDKELEQASQRLSSMEEHAKKETSLDLYLILGVKRTDTAAEIKKAYRKAALKHHPDKAGQLLVRSESGDDGRLWKEIADSVHKDSDRLFKMIGEAYAVLSDPEKREEYDLKEDIKSSSASRASGVNRSASRREYDFYGYADDYSFERSTNRRQWQGGFKSRYSSGGFRW